MGWPAHLPLEGGGGVSTRDMHDFSKLLLILFDLFYVVDLHNQGH